MKSELNVEREKNEKLQNKLDEYEQTIKNKDNEIEKLNEEKASIDNAKKESEERFKQKISKMDKSHTDKINSLKNIF